MLCVVRWVMLVFARGRIIVYRVLCVVCCLYSVGWSWCLCAVWRLVCVDLFMSCGVCHVQCDVCVCHKHMIVGYCLLWGGVLCVVLWVIVVQFHTQLWCILCA